MWYMTHSTATEWDVRTESGTVVVELPDGIELDKETGEQINDAFEAGVTRPRSDTVLTLLRVNDPMGSGLFEEVQHGAELAGENGIDRWAIVVEETIKGMAFESNIEGLETEVFEDQDAAREWLAGGQ